jgi:hypothetical protein
VLDESLADSERIWSSSLEQSFERARAVA